MIILESLNDDDDYISTVKKEKRLEFSFTELFQLFAVSVLGQRKELIQLCFVIISGHVMILRESYDFEREGERERERERERAVSYTHLTLPTTAEV